MKDVVEFTKSQDLLLKDIKDWDESNKSLSYVISGQAGTGKSFIIKYIIKNVFKNKRVCVSAPTHKAVKVIESFTGIKGFTLHSLHGLRPNFSLENFNIDKLKFNSVGSNKFMKYHIIIIDESSMIGDDLKKLNDIRSLQYNVKIIYIGDKLQLLPISSHGKLSSIFDNKFGFELTDIVRQASNSPMHIAFKLLRDDILNNTANFINHIKSVKSNMDNGLGYITVPGKTFSTITLQSFSSIAFKNDVSLFKIGAFTNNRINDWNRFVRSKLISEKVIIAKGDLLMGYQTIVDEYLSPIIINSNDYIVLDVKTKISDYKFKMFIVEIKDLTTGFINTINIVDHTDKSFIKYYNKLYNLHHTALYGELIKKGELWKNFYNFKHLYLTMIDFDLISNNGVKVATVKKEIDYGYAVTIHKLQGSTINTMLLDSLDIIYYRGNKNSPRTNTNNNPRAIEQRNRLLYTGLSRTSKKAIILY